MYIYGNNVLEKNIVRSQSFYLQNKIYKAVIGLFNIALYNNYKELTMNRLKILTFLVAIKYN